MGAAFLTVDGQIIKGANIENASYGMSVSCAVMVFGDEHVISKVARYVPREQHW